MAQSEGPNRTATQEAPWIWSAVIGLVGGMVAGMVMAVFAMIAAATYQTTGFFTPLYHIGSAFGSGEAGQAMMASMERAGSGELYHFVGLPAALGMGIHLMTGGLLGAAFGLLVRALRVTRAAVVPLGVAYGLVVMLVMAYAVLPVVASVFNSGPPIRDMAMMVVGEASPLSTLCSASCSERSDSQSRLGTRASRRTARSTHASRAVRGCRHRSAAGRSGIGQRSAGWVGLRCPRRWNATTHPRDRR